MALRHRHAACKCRRRFGCRGMRAEGTSGRRIAVRQGQQRSRWPASRVDRVHTAEQYFGRRGWTSCYSDAPGYDLLALLHGSEGMLGVISEATEIFGVDIRDIRGQEDIRGQS